MRIKEFFIKRYGPLREISYALSHPFNLLIGNNEDGKTLAIDALVKLLLGRQVRDFGHIIDRVEENPEGYCVIEGDDGKEIKLPEHGDLTTIAAVTASECRNIFIIRDSDLSIAQESEFYTTVTNRLMGLRTEEILKTKEALREIGRITPSGIFRDIKDEALKTRIEWAQDLVDTIEGLTEEMSAGKFDELEEEAVRLQEEIERIRHDIEDLEDARKRDKYEKGKAALDRLTTALESADKFKQYNDNDAQVWRDCEKDIQRHREDKKALVDKLKGNEEELKGIDKALREKTRGFRIFEDRKKTMDELKAELNLYEMKRREGVEREQRASIYMRMGITSSLLLGISLIGLIFRPSPPIYVAAALFLIATVAFWTPQVQRIRDRAWLAGTFERIKLALAKFKWSGKSVEEIYARIQQFDEELRERSEEIQEMTRRKENVTEGLAELRNRTIPDEERKINDAQERTDDIRNRSGAESRQAYQQGLTARKQQEKSSDEALGILRNLLGKQGEILQDNMTSWQRELKALEQYRDSARGIQYDEGAVTQLKEASDTAKATLASLYDIMNAFHKRLEEIEREANKTLQSETEYLHCTTSVDLEAVRDKLRAFVSSNEGTRDTVLKIMDIFEEIEAAEREKVAELFGAQNPVSRYFGEITDGLYDMVFFNQERRCIEVRRKDGMILEAEKLSGGAYDQLYLAIRLALGEKILEGKKGFFIMDDPFVKADPERLGRQIAMLQSIAELGWQVIYFSAKGEIRDVLKAPIKRGVVNQLEIQGIFS
ncbi:MAG: AAA family ATPase [Deltaproteobacteria bacterium]|nr:AAA family ATPase [Deltaproteobacteria bacterium]